MTDKQPTINGLRRQLGRTMHADRLLLRRQLDRLTRRRKSLGEAAFTRQMADLTTRVEAAVLRRQYRLERVPRFDDLDHLPITAAKADIVEAIRNHPVVIISGETGSGKTTQIPKFCLAAGRGVDGKIACTQPRRIAATTVSERIAEELGEALGRSVGYKIRFQDKSDPDAYIKVVTDGILLAETQGDSWLNEYDTIIVDEAHERSLNIDFVLGILKRLVQRRRNLKLIITSATIDTEKFSKAFDDAPVIEVSGRLFPVETRYFFPDAEPEDREDRTTVELAAQAIDELIRRQGRGDILVFMPTEQDIRETCEVLEGRGYPRTLVLPLFARLSPGEQKRVFASTGFRKIIVATNVAETSITIPGIRYVVDTGLARISQYVPRSRTTSLPVAPISRSSADQRKGRCGRVQNGVCIRLFAEEDYLNRPLFTQPEILRANLAEVILRMIALKLGDVADFPFVDRPAEKSIRDGFNLLEELGAIGRVETRRKGAAPYRLTETGRIMARMPIDPRLSRMLIEAQKEHCLSQMTVIAAALSIQDVRERPLDREAQADQAHRRFVDPLSDFITILNIWQALHTGGDAPRSMNALKKFCRQHFLSFRRIREWRDIHRQITAVLREQGLDPGGNGDVPVAGKDAKGRFHPLYAAIQRSILSGFLSNIAMQKEKVFFRAAREREVMIFPGSGLFKNPGSWIVAAEMVETSRLYARTVATIDVAWLEPLGGALCRRSTSDPHWSRSRGEVVAREQVTLFGLPIVQDRQVAFGRIDAEKAADIFIRSALIEMDVKQPLGFMQHNADLVAEVRGMEDRIRRRDILVDDESLVAFYRERLPGVCDIRTLKYRIRKQGGDGFLRLDREMLTRYRPEETVLAQFPQKLDLGHRVLDCDYVFDPGTDADGITVTIPAETTGDVPREQLDWLVPGLLAEKITALIKGLPKAYRVQLVPVAETVETIVDKMPRGRESLTAALSRFLFEHLQVDIPASAWPIDQLPEHLRMRLSITDAKGRVVASGRDETLLDQQSADPALPPGLQAIKRKWERTGIADWDFGDLPEVLSVEDRQGMPWRIYPRLAVENEAVGIRVFTDSRAADAAHRDGVAALLARRFADDVKFLKKNLKLPGLLKRQVVYFGGMAAVEAQLVERVSRQLFAVSPLTAADFDARVAELMTLRVHGCGQDLREAVIAVIEAHHETQCRILEIEQKRIAAPVVAEFLETLKGEARRLVPDNFVQLYDRQRLLHLVRYLKTIAVRVQRGLTDLAKDRARQDQVAPYTATLNAMLKSMNGSASVDKRVAVEEFFWAIEEYKVSLFAQEVGTDGPISPKRLKKMIGEIERMV
ncbi:ATP-dependent helicase [Desulfosarcina ovata subsp. sediminis]|uniref:ATP-dependent helicase n=1 Tax=Desulfosarcina ovata subsp. sediminis TaxID=885957 RepID=A0A5K7ZT19_9BACT|nr:ATP-dependent RNA helicase HrpA [Desulfosarcina ovata]BBO83363.1 ATP-dependent helicase [Desulfosarcina ovata subsp. sediminis]